MVKPFHLLPHALRDRLIRRALPMDQLPLDRFSIRVARTAAEYRDAFQLVYSAYLYEGYESAIPYGMRITEQHVLPESTVLVAYEGERIVGTMTIVEDSRAGLPLQQEYPQVVDDLRAGDAHLVEYTSLTVVKRLWAKGIPQLLALAAGNMVINHLAATHVLAGVNPKAVDVYRALYGFAPIGEAKTHTKLTAPVAGMVLDLERADRHIRRWYKRPMSTGRRPYDHFRYAPPSCVALPPLGQSKEALAQWKLPREVFQELFLASTDRVTTLSPRVAALLRERRSRATLTFDSSLAGRIEPDRSERSLTASEERRASALRWPYQNDVRDAAALDERSPGAQTRGPL